MLSLVALEDYLAGAVEAEGGLTVVAVIYRRRLFWPVLG